MPGEAGEPACCGAPVSSSRCAWAGTSWRSPSAEGAAAAAGRGAGERNSFRSREKPANPPVAARQFLLRAVRGLEPRGDRHRLRGLPRRLGEKLGRETHSGRPLVFFSGSGDVARGRPRGVTLTEPLNGTGGATATPPG